MVTTAVVSENFTLEDWMRNPPEHMEWVDGKLVEKDPIDWGDGKVVEKNGMTLKHSRIQVALSRYWANYTDSSGQGGEVYADVPCRTNKQGRRPDVAYLTPELVAQFGELDVLPQSFPLIAEIVSPTDIAEEVFLKAQEYLQSGCEEVWLVFPSSRLVLVMTQSQIVGFTAGEVVSTQRVLQGFSVAVDELLA
jgi:Uma2 family endonuclease